MYSVPEKKIITLFIGLLVFQFVFSQPVIQSFSPASGPIGSIVNITGSGFSSTPANNIVYFGTVKSKVVSSTSNSLQVIVPAGASYEPMSVTTGNLTAYSNIPFVVTFTGAGSVFPSDIYNTRIDADIANSDPDNGYGYYAYMTVVDLDDDGKTDMISSNNFPKTISVLRNTSVTGKISFEPHKEFSTHDSPNEITHADFDGDGMQDIITACNKTVSIFKNRSTPGAINLSTRIDIDLPTYSFQNIAINDVDRDGKPDFVVTGHNSQTILLYRNTSIANNITFDQPVVIPVSYGYESVALKDVDGDSKPDLLITFWGYSDYYIQVAKNLSTVGNVVFDNFLTFRKIRGANDIDLGDLDGDDKLDIVTPNNQNYNFSVLQNSSVIDSISFNENQDFYVGTFPQRLALGDIDGDGKVDVAISDNNYYGFTVSIYKNLSVGNEIDFTSRLDLHGNASDDLAMADMDGDGKPEIEVAGTDYSVICVFTSCPQGTITQQPQDSLICISGNAAFSVITTDTTAGYQWQVQKGNGWSDLSNDATYNGVNSNNLLVKGIDTSMNGYFYRCVLINKCAITNSDSALLTVRYPSPPVITIKATDTLICPSTIVTYTAASKDGGTDPVYEWKKNNIVVGTNADVFSDSTIKDGDKIICTLISDASCLSNNTGTSNEITMHVTGQITPQVSVTASSYDVCSGSKVIFTAATINAGTSPLFQWMKNNIVVGTNSSIYIDSSLNNNDSVYCIVFPDLKCIAGSVSSNKVAVQVNPLLIPTITIAASKNNICPKDVVDFTSNVSNAGNAAMYNWKKNGIDVGINSSLFSDSLFNEGDSISCILHSNATGCLVTNVAASNSITIHLQSLPGAADLGADKNICPGSTATITTSETYSSYLWQDNTVNSSITVTKPGIYYVKVSDACNSISSDTIVVTEYLQPTSFLPADTSVCSYDHIVISPNQNFSKYLWSNNSTAQSIDINIPGIYWLQVTDNNTCTGRDSITVAAKDCMHGVYIPSAFSPNGDGNNDLFKPLVFGVLEKYEFIIYNRFGQQVFRTTEAGKGWDGSMHGKRQNMNVFVWVCIYKLQGEIVTQKKGTVVLVTSH